MAVYIKPGLDTPADTAITARLNSGQSMNIFLEVIKKAASISGTVYTGGMPLVKGYVKSLGPKACCKIDLSGQYSLPKVFMGHSRSVIATWWTSENGQKIRHREEKVIDFFDSDLTGFNFGNPPTPTATPTCTITPSWIDSDTPYYSNSVSLIFKQFALWKAELGSKEAAFMVQKWLNRELAEGPQVPENIAKVFIGYEDDPNEPALFLIEFSNGVRHPLIFGGESGKVIQNMLNSPKQRDFTPTPTITPNNKQNKLKLNQKLNLFRSTNMLFLDSFEWQLSGNPSPFYSYTSPNVQYTIADMLGDQVTKKMIISNAINTELTSNLLQGTYQINYKINPDFKQKVVRPSDFELMNYDKTFGVVFITAHWGKYCISIGNNIYRIATA